MNAHQGAGDRRTVAVIGSGISGLTAAHLAQRRHDVTLFESDDRLGGHAHTHDVVSPAGAVIGVDSGFIVHNTRTYPNLLRLFSELGVATQETEMSMSIDCHGCGLQYAGARGLGGLFAQRGSVRDIRYLRMLTEVVSFHRHARRLLDGAAPAGMDPDDITLGEFLAARRHSRYFVHHFAVPVVSAVWSSGASDALSYPARYLFAFLQNHGMLSVTGSPQWQTVTGGSQRYVDLVTKGLTSVRTSTPVRSVRRRADGIELRDGEDTVHAFDHVVVATHAPAALALLADPTPTEQEILGAFHTSRNETVLHSDHRSLPATPGARASWNYRVPGCQDPGDLRRPVAVTYDMNRLQRLGPAAGGRRYLVTLGDTELIDPETVIDRMKYEHPVYTRESVAAQRRLPELDSTTTVFAGAWQGWGFHEDGCRSGVRAARHLGVAW